MGNICLVSHSSPFSSQAHVSALCHLFAEFLFTQHSGWHQSRTVYMDRFTFAALNKYLDEERRELFLDVDEVFVAFKGVARGRPLTENALQHTLDYYEAKCGVSLHAHLFRHTGITHMVQQGMSEPAIRKLVGHRNAQSLEPYLHLADRFVETEFEKAQVVLQPRSWLSLPQGEGRKKFLTSKQ
jgi:integrase/recombinase XerD